MTSLKHGMKWIVHDAHISPYSLNYHLLLPLFWFITIFQQVGRIPCVFLKPFVTTSFFNVSRTNFSIFYITVLHETRSSWKKSITSTTWFLTVSSSSFTSQFKRAYFCSMVSSSSVKGPNTSKTYAPPAYPRRCLRVIESEKSGKISKDDANNVIQTPSLLENLP